MKKIILLLAIVLTFTGCGKPDFYNKPESLKEQIISDIESKKDEKPIKIVKVKNPILEDDLGIDLLTQEIHIEMKEPLPVDKFFASLAYQNVNVSFIYNLSAGVSSNTPGVPSDTQPSGLMIHIPYFKGKLSDLLKTLMDTHGIFFRYKNNTLIATQKESFSVYVDNYPDIGKALEQSLKALGAESVTYDALSSRVSFRSTYKSYLKIKEYLKNLSNNLSVITLYLIVGEVELSSDTDRGINWDALINIYKKNSPPTGGTVGPTTGLEGEENNRNENNRNENNRNNPITAVPEIVWGDKAVGAQINNISGLTELTFAGVSSFGDYRAKFLINLIIKNLERYGKVYILQNTYITLFNGFKGKIDASRKTPYVKEIGTGVIGTTGATQTVQTVTFEEADSGVVIEITPIFNAQTELLTLNIDSKIQNVPEYVTVSAGNYSVSRPIVIARNIKTQVVMKADSLIVLGGLISESELNSSSTALTGINRTKSKKNSELVIIIKPEVTRFVFE